MYKGYLLVGIGGSGMRGLAYLLASKGITIFGTDRLLEGIKDDFDLQKYHLITEKAAAQDLTGGRYGQLIYSDAVPASHPLRLKAKEMGVTTLGYQEALGAFANQYTTIAVAGTHGKSSTTAMLAHVLIGTGKDPSVLLGAHGNLVPDFGGYNARIGQGKLFIVEADEYREHFLSLKPAGAIITTIDYDHPDYFKSLQEVANSFGLFLGRLEPDSPVVVDEQTYEAFALLPWPQKTQVVKTKDAKKINLKLPGEHMQHNARLAVAMAMELGISPEAAIKELESFTGIGRRFENIGRIGEMEVISDYGHHPMEIRMTLAGAKEAFGQKKIAVMLEAHTLARLQMFWRDFADALSLADRVVLAPVFIPEGREKKSGEADEWLQKIWQALVENEKKVDILRDCGCLQRRIEKLSLKYRYLVIFSAGLLDGKMRQLLKLRRM